MNRTTIPWTDYTWNPVTGCTPCSIGCEHCYAQAMLKRFKKPTTVTFHLDRLDEPKHLRKPSRIFVCSMSDLFHEDVDGWRFGAILDVMRQCPRHTFQLLTKRSKDLCRYSPHPSEWPINIWLGVSVENQAYVSRIGDLELCHATVPFVSFEPLLGPITLAYSDWRCLRWVIVGGETGPGARPMNLDWARSIRDQCVKANVPFFFKQQGGPRPFDGETLLDGMEWKQFPKGK